jgi:NAD-dependent DNA ligase
MSPRQPKPLNKRRAGLDANATVVDRSVQRLAGVLKGIAADQDINEKELTDLHEWVTSNDMLVCRWPFSEIEDTIQRVLADGVISSEEHAELLWLCDRFLIPNRVYDSITVEIRKLHGYLQGIAADQEINVAEVQRLQSWCEGHRDYSQVWPFDATIDLLVRVLADGRIDPVEHKELIAYCADFSERVKFKPVAPKIDEPKPWNSSDAPVLQTLTMVCSKNPNITFAEHRFCFTGQCQEGDREEMSLKVTNRGGFVVRSISRLLNYLVIGGNSNPCWTYSAYGRKIEKAIDIQRAGHALHIVHEDDFMRTVREIPVM